MKTLSRTIAVAVLLSLGCSIESDIKIGRAVQEERWEDAIALLEERVESSPEDPTVLRDLGRAYFEAGRYGKALTQLREARKRAPEDHSLPLLIGLCLEGMEEWQKAIDEYRSYPGARGGSTVARAVRGRMARLVREVYADQAAELLEEPAESSRGLLAVRYFEVLAEAETYGNLGKGVAEQLIADFSRIEEFHVVSRLSYEALLVETERLQAEGYEPLHGTTLDGTLGAGWSLGGTILPREENDEIRIDFFIVNNSTGETFSPSTVSGSLSEFFELEKRVAYEVVETLGVTPATSERQAIAEIPTTNFRAFLAYCDALDAEDRGEYDEARGLFEQAARLDPDFVLAAERAERTRGSREMIVRIAEAEIALPEEERRADRIGRTAAMLLPAPVPEKGEASDHSNVRPLGNASLIIRVDQP